MGEKYDDGAKCASDDKSAGDYDGKNVELFFFQMENTDEKRLHQGQLY